MFRKIFLLCILLSFEANALESFAPVVDKVMPSVVNISTQMRENEDSPEIENSLIFSNDGHVSLGSGFFADNEGYVLTNRHVIEKAKKIKVTTFDGKTYDAEIKGEDKILDVALIKINPQIEITAAQIADSDKVKVGDWVVAIGNPFGLSDTVTVGIVSAKSRNIKETPFDDYIQTDAPINPGNSGGPMFNLDGEVVGLNTLIFSKQGNSLGVGFAIPSNQLKPIYESLKKTGEATRKSIGVNLKETFDQDKKALIVSEILDSDLAKQNDLETGDKILSYNNKPITTLQAFQNEIVWWNSDNVLQFQIERNGEQSEKIIEVKPLQKLQQVTKPEKKQEGVYYPEIGLYLNNFTIVDVDPKSEAQEKGIQIGDELLQINNHALAQTTDLPFYITESISEEKSLHLSLKDASGMYYFVDLMPSGKQ